MELTDLVPDRRLAMRGVAGFPFPVRILAELEPADGGALVRWTTYLEPGGIVGRANDPLAVRANGFYRVRIGTARRPSE